MPRYCVFGKPPVSGAHEAHFADSNSDYTECEACHGTRPDHLKDPAVTRTIRPYHWLCFFYHLGAKDIPSPVQAPL